MLDLTTSPQSANDISRDLSQIVGDGLITGSSAGKRETYVNALVADTLKKQGPNEAFDVAKKLVQLNPNALNVLLSFYNSVQRNYAASELGRQVANEYTKLANDHMSLLCEFFRTPPLHTTTWMLERIGEAADQTAGVIKAQRMGLLKYKPVMCLTGKENVANRAFIPYLADAFDLLTSPKEINAFKCQRVLPRFDSYLMRFSNDIFGHASEYEPDLNSLLRQNGISTTAFSLKESTKEIAIDFLKQYDLRDGDDFITLHIREPGYDVADSQHHNERNENPQSFQKAIDYFLTKGLKVVRIGHEKMSTLEARKGFIDLTKVNRPGEVDIFLCASNKFYFGSGSGPYSLSYQFGKPSLISEQISFMHARPNCLTDMKQYYDVQTDKVANFEQLKKLDLDTNTAPAPFRENDLRSHKVREDDILNSAKEMIGLSFQSKIVEANEKLNDRKKDLKINTDVMFTSRSLNLLS